MDAKEAKQFQKRLFSGLESQLKDLGFAYDPSRQALVRKTTQGSDAVFLSFILHLPTDFDVTVSVGVRFDSLQELVDRNDRLMSAAEKAKTSSLGCELGNLTEGRQRRWTVRNEGDVSSVASEIGSVVAKSGLDYLNKFASMESALEALSGDDAQAFLHMPFHEARAKRAVGLSFLMKRADLNQLIERKSEFLRSRNDPQFGSFRKFVEGLEVV